jgi:hypothetical protein
MKAPLGELVVVVVVLVVVGAVVVVLVLVVVVVGKPNAICQSPANCCPVRTTFGTANDDEASSSTRWLAPDGEGRPTTALTTASSDPSPFGLHPVVGANLFFQLVSRRYERGPMILTSNRASRAGVTSSGTA